MKKVNLLFSLFLAVPVLLSAQTWKIHGESKGIAQLITPQTLVLNASPLYMSKDGGLTKSHEIAKPNSSNAYAFVPYFMNENDGYGVGYHALYPGKDIWKTHDGGKTWFLQSYPNLDSATYDKTKMAGVANIQSFNGKNGVLHGGLTRLSDDDRTYAIFYTIDSFKTFTDITPPDVKNFDLIGLHVVMMDDNTIYALPRGGYGLFKTTDAGANWTKISTAPATMPRKLQVLNSNLMFLLQDGATGTNKLVKSTDDAATFVPVNLPTQMRNRKIVNYTDISFLDEMNGLLATSDGYSGAIFITADGGENWIETTIPEEITKLTGSWGAGGLYFINKDFAYAGAADKLLVFGESGSVGIDDIKSETSGIFLYPNPATENVTIKINNANGKSSYRIFSVNGQLISHNIFTASGSYSVNVPLNGMLPGIYFIEVVCGNEIYREKVIVR